MQEEVIVTKQKLKTATDKDAFYSKDTVSDKESLIVVDVIKVGEKQNKIKVGDELLIHESGAKSIDIRNQGNLPNTFIIFNTNPIVAVLCQ